MECTGAGALHVFICLYRLRTFADISLRAFAHSMSNLSLRAMSPRLSIPTTFPFSTTGSRRTWRPAMSCAAERTSSSGDTVIMLRLIISLTGVISGSFSAATHLSTMSLSVTIPRSLPSLPHTGRLPRLCRDSSLAATAALSSWDIVTGFLLISSLTNIISLLFVLYRIIPFIFNG